RLDIGQTDHLAPFLGFLRDELAEVGGRAAKLYAIQIGKPRFDIGIGKAGIDLRVELFDDLCGRAFGRARVRKPSSLQSRAKYRSRSVDLAAPANAPLTSPPSRAACRL